MVWRKSVLLMLQPNPTRVWDTFAEPNNLTMPSVAFIQNQASSCQLAWPRPKSRLTEEGCGCWQLKTCLYGVQKHLAKSSGLFLFLVRGLRFEVAVQIELRDPTLASSNALKSARLSFLRLALRFHLSSSFHRNIYRKRHRDHVLPSCNGDTPG